MGMTRSLSYLLGCTSIFERIHIGTPNKRLERTCVGGMAFAVWQATAPPPLLRRSATPLGGQGLVR